MPLTIDNGHLYLRWTYPSPPVAHHLIEYHEPPTWANHNSKMSISEIINDPPTTPARSPKLLPATRTQNSHELSPHGKQPTIRPLHPTLPESYAQAHLPPSRKKRTFTEVELRRIHRHFSHASARKLYELLKCSTTDTVPSNTLTQLEEIVAACQTCQTFASRPVSFQVRLADKLVFNRRLILDLLWLPTRNPLLPRKTRPALHIVDQGTRFNAATFVDGESSSTIWNAFLRAWASLYVGMPTSMLVDKGSVFVSDEWQYACELNGISLTTTGIESHNSLGPGESYHAYLRRVYNKVLSDYKDIDEPTALSISVEAINDCTGPKGLCPTLLVF